MKAEEKKLIYDLLKNASGNLNGYTTPAFASEPVFSDDVETVPQPVEVQPVAQQTVSVQQTVTVQQTAVPDSPKPKTSIADINEKIQRCTRCILARTRNNVVPGMGVEHPEVMVIGEGPGYDEDMQGLPFVGKAGMLLDKMLAAIQLSRADNCYIANVVKCRPPQNRDPLPEEQAACISFLEAQIHVLKPKMILCMGRISAHKLLNSEAPIGDLHGKIFDYNGIPLMVTYHPSALLRNEALKKPAWEDLKAFRKHLDTLK